MVQNHQTRLGAANIRSNLLGGATAAVVALPLAMAFGVASGAGPIAGMYGAIFVGFFAALFGGTKTQVSGPTGPMTVVMAAIFTRYGSDPALAFTIVMLGGAFQVLFGVLRIGNLISYVPFTVVSGFMSGIGCIIILLQLSPLVGHSVPDGGTIGALMALPENLTHPVFSASLIGAVSLAIVYLTPKKIAAIVPPPLLALIVGTVGALYMTGVPVLGEIPTGWPQFHMPAIQFDTIVDVLTSAVTLALLGSIDSLLTSLVADNMTRTRHNSNRELIGQGIGNMVAGLFGGIPGAGATMRTVVNIRSGGTNQISGMVHALILLAVVLGLGPLASHIPHAVLAGILIKVGIDIIDWQFLRRLPRAPRPGVGIMMTVLGLTVFVDLIIAVAVGLIAASLLMLKRTTDLQLSSIRAANGEFEAIPLNEDVKEALEEFGDKVAMCYFGQALTFGAARGVEQRVMINPNVRVLILDLSDVPIIDTSIAIALEHTIENAKKQNVEVLLVGLRAPVLHILEGLGVAKLVDKECLIGTRIQAVARVREILETGDLSMARELPETGAEEIPDGVRV